MNEDLHALDNIATFTQERTGWTPVPEGGQVPVYTDLPAPVHRWYCRCGEVGGRTSTVEAAAAGHAAHVERATA